MLKMMKKLTRMLSLKLTQMMKMMKKMMKLKMTKNMNSLDLMMTKILRATQLS